MRIVGLTGGIGSGKSTVSNLFKAHGIPVVDADVVARNVLKKGTGGWRKVRAAFGDEIFLPSGEVDRPKLGQIVFNDPDKRQLLNRLLAPYISSGIFLEVFKLWMKGCKTIVLDVPLLFEAKIDKWTRPIIVVWVDPETQLRRLMARDGTSTEEAKSRINSQMPLDLKMAKADILIDNSGSLDDLNERFTEWMEKDPVSGDSSEPLTYQTWILRVPIHCGGCIKKVKKILQSIEGVYKIDIDSKQHKVIVTGNVDSTTLVKKLIKSGKNAGVWSENASDADEKKTEQVENTTKDNCDGNGKGPEGDDASGDDHTEEKGGAPQVAAQSGGGGGGGGGGKKKKKKKKKGNAASTNAAGGGGGAPGPASSGSPPPPPPPPPPEGNTGPPADKTNPDAPNQQIFSYPQFYYGAPEYGMSNNTAPPNASMAPSYYTFPVHSYTYYHPHDYLPPSPFDPVVAISRSDDCRSEEEICSIM